MAGQLIEILIFAAIAFFLINKLIATLGTTSEEDKNRGGFFGETSSGMKDVTNAGKTADNFKNIKSKLIKTNLKGQIIEQNEVAIRKGIDEVKEKFPSFELAKFLKGARAAFSMIIESVVRNDLDALEQLIDRRYLEKFGLFSDNYGNIKSLDNLEIYISEIYMFGNNIFIKLVMNGNNVTDKIFNLEEEWTFTKNILNSDPAWHLTNIDRPH